MVVPFGFSIGDFIASIGAFIKGVKALRTVKGASDQFNESIESFDMSKNRLRELYRDYCSITPLEQQDNAFRTRAQNRDEVVKEYSNALERYEKHLGGSLQGRRHKIRRMGKSLKWAFDSSIPELVEKLQNEVNLLEKDINHQHNRNMESRLTSEVMPPLTKIYDIRRDVREMRAQKHQDDQGSRNICGFAQALLKKKSSERSSATRREALKWLAPLAGVFETKQQDIYGTRDRQDGLAHDVIKRPEFKEWRAGKGQNLCCFGKQGIGKTFLASIVINHLKAETGEGSNTGLAFVFCNNKESIQQTPEALVSSILQQLLCNTTILEQEVIKLYESHTQRSTKPRLDEYTNLLRSAIEGFNKVYIVVDAIDELSRDVNKRSQNLLEELARLTSANIFLTSRDLPVQNFWVQHTTQIEIRALDSDISNYLQERLSSDRVPRFIGEYPKRKETIINGIISKVNGMFLLASLQIDSLLTKTNWRDLSEAINTLPEKLHDAFTEIIERIKRGDSSGTALKILYWINYASRELTVDEIQHALAVRLGDRKLDPDGFLDEESITAMCCGLVAIQKEARTITLRHDSVREHLQRDGTKHFPSAQADIQQTLLTYMSFGVFAQGPCECDEDIDQRVNDYPLLRYIGHKYAIYTAADEYMATEARKIAIELLRDNAKVSSFIQILHHQILKPPGDQRERNKRFKESQDDRCAVHRLWLAACLGLTEDIQHMLDGTTVLEETGYGETALHSAARSGRADIIELLIEAGADINALNQNGDTAILIVSSRTFAEHARSLRVLLNKGANIEAKDNNGGTALHHAASSGNEGTLRLLLEKNPDIEAKYNNGWTALHFAANSGNEGTLRLLLEKNPDIEAKNNDGRTALHHAASSGNEGTLRLLLEKNPDIEAKDNDGRTTLHFVANSGNEGTLRLLLEKNPDIEAKNNDGRTALHHAASSGNEGTLRLLLEKNADVEAKDNDGFTAVHHSHNAVNEGHILRMLFSKGADANASGPTATPPLWAAVEAGRLEIVEIFLDNGADPFPRLYRAGKNNYDEIFSMLWKKAATGGRRMADSEFLVLSGDTQEIFKQLLQARARMLLADITLDFNGSGKNESEVEKFVRYVDNVRALGLELQNAVDNGRADTEVEKFVRCVDNVRALGLELQDAVDNGKADIEVEMLSEIVSGKDESVDGEDESADEEDESVDEEVERVNREDTSASLSLRPFQLRLQLQEASMSGKSALFAALRVYSKTNFDETINTGIEFSGIDFTAEGAIRDASSTSLSITLDAALDRAIGAGRHFANVRLSLTIALLLAILQKATIAQSESLENHS